MSKRQVFTILHWLTLAIVLAILLVWVVPVSIDSADTVVNFPDPNLEAAIRQAIGKPTGDIYQSDLDSLAALHAENRGISELSGLEHCTSLTDLRLGSNSIGNISPLSSLTSLAELYLSSNHISNISPLSGLTNLTLLNLLSNNISDISPLSGLDSLTWLSLYSNQVGNLSPLSGLTSLSFLELSSNEISDLSPLSSLNGLSILYLESNQISGISALSSLTSVIYLSLESNQISDLSPLSGLTSLIRLDLTSNQIDDILPLVNNPGLATGDSLYLQNNPLSSNSINVYIPELQGRGVTVYYDIPTPVTGITREVNGNILPGVSVTLDGAGTVISDQNGYYEILATSTGSKNIVAHKAGFKDRTKTINISGLGQAYAVTCNFQGNYGLIPNAPNMQYALSCINRWLYPPNPDIGLTMQTALAVINAWLYPVQ